ncbi:MAG: YgeY family selenium metabolism-linked hydrolase, partial [Chloroflexi bacterium CFX1]|nr:YgeY family selenium metabolism-linked hydrolase [Chloroflexi bacterium CFX1]MCQ3954765.1 YgeY family selenium metabolism-linked hydrolase [Chloroflexota bacterium]
MDIESLIEFTQRIVRQPSMSGEEGAVTRLVVDEMNALGFDKVWVDKYGSAV